MTEELGVDDKFIDLKNYPVFPPSPEKGDELQKLSVVQSLPTLINQDSHSTLTRVIPKIQQELFHSSSEFQVTTSHIFQILISNHLYANEGCLTSTLVQNLDSKDPVVAHAWLETLLEVVTQLPLKVVITEIVPLAAHKGQCSQPMLSRIACCRILGHISSHPNIKPLEIKKHVLPTVHGLCQDIIYNVRASICEQIPIIVQGLGCSLSKVHLIPNLVELTQDDNQNVRGVAVSSVINCLPFLDKETKTQMLAPLILQLAATSMKEEGIASMALAKDMGVLFTHLNGCIPPVDAEAFVGYFMELGRRGLDIKRNYYYQNTDSSQDVLCRQYCASNLPACISFLLNNNPTQIEKLYEIIKSLACDSCYLVRQTVSGIIHELARILGNKNSMLKPEFVRLLRDDAEEVLSMLVPHLYRSFELFEQSGTLSIERVTPTSIEISKAILKCLSQLKKGYNWRLLSTFLKQLECLPRCFRSDQIHNDFTPAIVQCAINGGTRPVRTQAGKTLLVILRWNTKQVQRTWLREHLISELAESNSCYTRHIFIQLCISANEIFSNKYFKENFFYPLLSLAEDPVSTVRYSMVSLIPTLKKMLRVPTDRKLLQSLEQTIMQLEKNEKDRDVLTNLIKRSKEMITPGLTTVNDEYELNQKRLMEEEELILKGKLTFQVNKMDMKPPTMIKRTSINADRNVKSIGRSVSVNRPISAKSSMNSNTSSFSARSTSVPRNTKPSRTNTTIPVTGEVISDMTFLNQHFYTDAGIPIRDIKLQKKNFGTNILQPDENASENVSDLLTTKNKIDDLLEVEKVLTNFNITDDVKVNLRNMTKKNMDKIKRYSHSDIPTSVDVIKNKRHSSIHSVDDVSLKKISNTPPNRKRRSLNLNPKEVSKIPVILRNTEGNTEGTEENKGNKTQEKNDKTINKKGSNLPVPLRRKPT